jgi:uncharacterized protein
VKFLFFIVHPSKYHVFKNTINDLKKKGHQVDICITSKDVLESLLRIEGWEYTNVFPEGRKISWLPTKVGAAFNLVRTILRLNKYLRHKGKYDLFITDDLLVVNGRINKTPSILFQDDDITAVPESGYLMLFADHILSPECSKMGRYQKKKIPFFGYKELGSLHPNRFVPDNRVVTIFNPDGQRYFLLRLVSLKATHDTGKKGLSNEDCVKIISIMEKYGRVFITSERKLSDSLEPYRINIMPNDLQQAIFYADLFVGDSQTMSAEAGVLGTPFIRYNDFVGKISYLNELENKYHLGIGIPTAEKEKLFSVVQNFASDLDIKQIYAIRRQKMLSEKIDLTAFMTWLFENYPQSMKDIKTNAGIQLRFQ